MSGISPVISAAIKIQARVRGHQLRNKQLRNKQLLEAAKIGDIDRTKNLIKHGADVNVTCKYKFTALHLAVGRANLEIVQLLLEREADVNHLNHWRTALQLAVFKGHPEIVKLLLAKGADVNITNKFGRTAVQIAANYGFADIVKTLVIAGSDVESIDLLGRTADHKVRVKKAIKAGKKELIAQLGALEHDHMWGEKSTGKLAALCKENSTKNNHIDVLNKPDLQRYICGFNNKPSLRLKKARQYSAEAATKIQAGFRGFKGRNIAKEAKEAAATKIQ